MGSPTVAPLWVIRPSTLERLSTQLGVPKLLLTDTGHLRDWRGVAELAGLAQDQHKFLRIKNATEPFLELFSQWKREPGVTVQQFWNVLEQVDRYDVLDDNMEKMLEDIRIAETTAASKGLQMSGLRRAELDTAGEALTYEDLRCLSLGKELPNYEAFVLYGDSEEDFVLSVLVPNLEAQGISVLVKDRDLLGGSFEHAAVMRLISGRCHKLIPVFSESFFNTEYNTFLANFAQHFSLEAGMKKLVPLVLGQCNIPSNLSIYHKLCYEPSNMKHKWFWSKLVKTLHPTGCFNPNIPMLDVKSPVVDTLTASAPKPIVENTPENTPVKPNKNNTESSKDKPNKLKENHVTPAKNSKIKVSKFKISSPFGRNKSDKSKSSSSDQPFQNLCEEPVSEPSTPVEDDEEGVNESEELLLPDIPTHEPGVVERVMGRISGKSSGKENKSRKYGSKLPESVA